MGSEDIVNHVVGVLGVGAVIQSNHAFAMEIIQKANPWPFWTLGPPIELTWTLETC